MKNTYFISIKIVLASKNVKLRKTHLRVRIQQIVALSHAQLVISCIVAFLSEALLDTSLREFSLDLPEVFRVLGCRFGATKQITEIQRVLLDSAIDDALGGLGAAKT